nr:MAG TPA: hypothetical protein [Caudoviricetes sp.]
MKNVILINTSFFTFHCRNFSYLISSTAELVGYISS